MSDLLKIIATLALCAVVTVLVVQFTSCKTQATRDKDETDECYYARYMAREGAQGASAIYADRCIKVLREQGCIKVIKENPGIYRDFNDCWKTRE